jgi:Rab proteins geranylgeranyltransferase component A
MYVQTCSPLTNHILMVVSAGIIYISLPLPSSSSLTASAEATVRPYLNATLSLASHPHSNSGLLSPIFSIFYYQHFPSSAPLSSSHSRAAPDPPNALVTPPLPPDLVRLVDAAATNAEAVFWATTRLCTPRAASTEGAEEWSVESLWPPAEPDAGDDDEEW